MKVRMIRMLLLATIVVLVSACGSMSTGMNNPLGTAQAGMWPESDIAGIVMTANEGEVQQGNAATARATSPEVRAFAQMMVSDHTSAMNTARDVFSRNAITPGENDTTRTLRDTSQRTVSNLNTYNGTAFDRTYMQSQVDVHQWLLTSLDTALIPSATHPEVRSLLQTQRASVATHLDRARQILNGLR
jgi:putative membrane protein